jgi:poly(3-hydroxybutyrate) depolymerase
MSLLVVAGCPVPPTPDTPKSYQFLREPTTGRGYFIYVPSTYTRSRPSPLIITCHGTPPYDIAEHHIREFKYYGEINNCIVVAPQLTGTDGIFGNGPTSGMLSDERFIMNIISTLGYQYNLDMANIMMTGFSGGGFPAYWIGLRHPDIFSVVVARSCNFSESNLASWYPPEATNIPIFVYYGEYDPVAIKTQSLSAIGYLQTHGFSITSMEIPGIGHERKPQVAMDFFRKHWRTARPSLPTDTSAR